MCRSSKKFLVVTLAQRVFIFLLHPKCNQAVPGPFRPSLLGKGWLVLGLVLVQGSAPAEGQSRTFAGPRLRQGSNECWCDPAWSFSPVHFHKKTTITNIPG